MSLLRRKPTRPAGLPRYDITLGGVHIEAWDSPPAVWVDGKPAEVTHFARYRDGGTTVFTTERGILTIPQTHFQTSLGKAGPRWQPKPTAREALGRAGRATRGKTFREMREATRKRET